MNAATGIGEGYQVTRSAKYQGNQTQSLGAELGATTLSYDANGYLVRVLDSNATILERRFVNDAQGQALQAEQAGHVERQMIANGQVLGSAGMAVDPLNPGNGNGVNFALVGQGVGHAGNGIELALGYQPISGSYPQGGVGTYVVQSGDTLQGIAFKAYGDTQMWYRIAEANGLDASSELKHGQTLTLPSGVGGVRNNTGTFQPYDPSRITGDTSPQLPTPSNKGGCGGLGQIVMIVVAIVATIYTAGAFAASGAFGVGAGASAAAASGVAVGTAGAGAFGATMAAGTAVLGGAAGAGVAMAAGAVGAAVGSIASQVVGNVIGAQDGFSWKQVAQSALGGAVSGGVGASGVGARVAFATQSSVLGYAAQAAVGNALTQGIGVATGLQPSFSWRSVAASAVGAATGAAVGDQLGLPANGQRPSGMGSGEFLGKSFVKGVSAGLATAVARGGTIAIQQVATDAFGNALGGSLAAASSGANLQESGRYGLSDGNSGLGLQAPAGWGSPSWSSSSAGYDQLVDAFSNPGAMDRSNDVLFATGPGYSGGTQRIDPGSMESIRQPDGTYRVEIVGHSNDITGPSVNGVSANAGSGTYEDPRTIVNPLTVRASDFGDVPDWQINNAGNGLRAPDYGSMTPIGEVEGFFTFSPAGRALKGAGAAVFDAWMTVPRALSGLGNLASDAMGYAGNAIAPQRSVLTGQPFAYQPKSAVLQSIQQQGMLGTLGAGITGAVRNAPGIGLIGALGTPNRDWVNVGAQVLNTGAAMAGTTASVRGSSVGVPVTRSANPLSPVLEFDARGNELMYRSMSREDYRHLLQTGELRPTTETSISPDFTYSSKYTKNNSVTVRFATEPGTSAALQEIGIAANPPAAQALGLVERNGSWMQTNTRFKVEGKQMTTQLGQGPGITIFNRGIVDFERMR